MFRFTIRELVLLTLVVAVGLGGIVAYSSARTEIRRLTDIIHFQESTIADLSKSVDLLMQERAPQPPSPLP